MNAVARLGALLGAEEAGRVAAALKQSKLPHRAAGFAFPSHQAEVKQLLKELMNGGDTARAVGVLEGIAAVPKNVPPDVVWTSASIPGSEGRTTIAALDLINTAERFVFAATYTAEWESPQLVALRNALDRGVRVTVVVDVKKKRATAEMIARRLPSARIWTLAEPAGAEWAIQHSKLIAVDDRAAFVTSANFSAAGVKRSLECGLLTRDPSIAVGVRQHIEKLYQNGILEKMVAST